MTVDVFPKYRHIVVVNSLRVRWPAKVLAETPMGFETNQGFFVKATRRKFGEPDITFDGPFTAEGDMESRP